MRVHVRVSGVCVYVCVCKRRFTIVSVYLTQVLS